MSDARDDLVDVRLFHFHAWPRYVYPVPMSLASSSNLGHPDALMPMMVKSHPFPRLDLRLPRLERDRVPEGDLRSDRPDDGAPPGDCCCSTTVPGDDCDTTTVLKPDPFSGVVGP